MVRIKYKTHQKKYARRTEYSGYIGEGRNFFFAPSNICVSIAWYGTYSTGAYKITFAFVADEAIALRLPDYPFMRTQRDKRIVEGFIQKNCEHSWSYWNYYAVCRKCEFILYGDYREIILRKEGVEAIDLNDAYIVETYGKEGLALRRARAGVNEQK